MVRKLGRFKAVLLLLVLPFLLTSCSFPKLGGGGLEGKATLSYWGLFEPPEVIKPIVNDYQEKKPNVTVDYQQKSYSTLSSYKETLLNRFKEGKGPDIARIHATWLKDFQSYLAPIPAKIMGRDEYAKTFFAPLREGASVGETLYGFPLMYDGLLLVANKKILEKEGVSPPKTWDEFTSVTRRMTKTDATGKKITQAGAAFGAYSNVAHAADILSLLFLQSGLTIPKEMATRDAVDALIFYTRFVSNPDFKIWDEAFPNSIIAFARGQVGLIFVPSWRLIEIKNLNPSLELEVVTVPQVPALEGIDASETHLASFWIEVVSKEAKAKEAAFNFLKFMSGAEPLRKLYALEAQGRLFGEPYPRTDLAEVFSKDPYLAPLMRSAPKARVSIIVDSSGNDPYVEAIGSAINAVVKGGDPSVSLGHAQKQIEEFSTTKTR